MPNQYTGYPPVSERFWTKVEFTDTCWLWKAAIDSDGYGEFWLDGKVAKAHRYAYTFCVGSIPDGLTIDHLCCTHNCVLPDHLEAVTRRENTLRGTNPAAMRARQTHCKYGHLFNEANTYHRTGRGGRACRACQRGRNEKLSAKRRAAIS